jgi:hypothetical protein
MLFAPTVFNKRIGNMKGNEFIHFATVTIIGAGSIAIVFLWIKNLFEDVNTKITGLWSNSETTFKVLIYNNDSSLQADVVWTDSDHDRILGKSILSNIKLNFFLFGKGRYTCPYTHQEYLFRLRRLSKESLQLYVTNTEGTMISNETWSLVG